MEKFGQESDQYNAKYSREAMPELFKNCWFNDRGVLVAYVNRDGDLLVLVEDSRMKLPPWRGNEDGTQE